MTEVKLAVFFILECESWQIIPFGLTGLKKPLFRNGKKNHIELHSITVGELGFL